MCLKASAPPVHFCLLPLFCTLSPEHTRRSDWRWHWRVAHFSISFAAWERTLCSCNLRAGFQLHRVHHSPAFIHLFILFVLGQNRGKQDRIHFAFFGRNHQCKAIRKLPSSLENEIIHELFHPRCRDLCLVRLHDWAFPGPFERYCAFISSTVRLRNTNFHLVG